MKKTLVLIVLLSAALLAEAQIRTPQPSPAGTVTTVVGLTDISIDYSRPRARGRKIFGEGKDFVVPYGAIWRTGANNGTVITFSDTVKVEGVTVPAGKYLVLTWPGATEWTVSLYKDVAMGGNTNEYDKAKDAANFKVKAEKVGEKVETLTFNIGDISDDSKSAKVQLTWENTSVKFTVTADFDSKVMKAIEANTKVNPGNLMAAARYYYDTGRDLKQALKWVDEYLAVGKNSEQFWNIHFKAQLLKKAGDKAGALAAANKSLEMAKKAENDFGYIKQNEDLIKTLK